MNTTVTVPMAADPVLAGRDRLLDPAFMIDHLGRVLTGGRLRPLGGRRTAAKYRWAESLRVVYELDFPGTTVLVAGRMFATAERAARAAAEARDRNTVTVAAPFDAVTLDPATNSVWFVAPADRRLPDLGLLDDPPAGLRSLPGGEWVRTELVQYAPERSATYRALAADGDVLGYAKLYRNAGDAADLAAFGRHVASGMGGGPVLVPAPLTLDAGLGVLVIEPLPGTEWNRVGTDRMIESFGTIGAGLARLHGLGRADRRRFVRLQPDQIVEAVAIVSAARPDLAGDLSELSEALLASRPEASPDVLLHGDVHPRNILVADTTVGLIDLDQAGWGSAANDLGGMLARLRHGVTTGELEAGLADRLAERFVEGYAAHRPMVDAAELRWYVSAALLVERALRAVTRVHPDGLRVVADTVSESRRVLEEPLR